MLIFENVHVFAQPQNIPGTRTLHFIQNQAAGAGVVVFGFLGGT